MNFASPQFGLTHGLLELDGADVVVSDAVLNPISTEATKYILKNGRLLNCGFWRDVMTKGVSGMLRKIKGSCSKDDLAALEAPLFERLLRMGVRAGIGYRKGNEFKTAPDFMDTFRDRAFAEPCSQIANLQRRIFKGCRNAASRYLVRFDFAALRHVELFTAFLTTEWAADGTLLSVEDMILEH
jgi:hypothetical protein